MKWNKFFGDRKFYRTMLTIAIPIMIQNGITNFVSLLDNIMVGQIGTTQMSSVSIVNQLIFVYSLCIFGGLSGAGIFSSQYVGKGDSEGLRYTVRFKLWIGAILTLIGLLVFQFGGSQLITLYLNGQADTADSSAALQYGLDYLSVMLVGLIPFAISQIYSSTLRETGETMLPMKAGVTAVFVNLFFNYILIFGHLGAPALGVTGAAIATVISRFVECFIVVGWTHLHSKQNSYIIGLYRSLYIPAALTKEIIIKGMPLLVNEALWSAAMAFLLQCYSIRGLSVIAAMNINSTLQNIFNIVFISMGSTVSIIVGQQLGSGKMEEAKSTATKMIVFSTLTSVFTGLLMTLFSSVFPRFYNTTEEVRALASQLIIVCAVTMPLFAFTNASYFTLRSGGKTVITFLFDSFYVWLVNIPLAYCLNHFTGLPVVAIYLIVQCSELLKCMVGGIMVHKGVWLNNMVDD